MQPKNFSVALRLLLAFVLCGATLPAFAGVGFDNQYNIRSGDLNGDGKTDLYVKWTPKVVLIPFDDLTVPIVLSRRDPPDFILQQAAGGTFTLINNLTAAQVQTASSWPSAPGSVVAAAVDVNFDGKLDLIIRNLKALIAGADPQIIYASTTPGAAPTNVRALNSTVRNFYREVGNWFKAPEVTGQIDYYQWQYLGYSYGYDPYRCLGYIQCNYWYDSASETYQYWGLAYVGSQLVKYHNYGLSDPTAHRFADTFYPTESTGEIQVPSSGATILQQILDQIWGQHGPVIIDGPPLPKDVEPGMRPDWDWQTISKHLFRIWFETCTEDTDTVQHCWDDMWSPGFEPSSYCADHGPFTPGGPWVGYVITAQQQTYNTTNQRRPFWVSRVSSCDPFAPVALAVVDNRGLGKVTLNWLKAIAQQKGLSFDEQQLGVEIMHRHVDITTADQQGIPHLLSKKQITDYHQEVFQSHGFPDYTFGGAPYGDDSLGGRAFEDFLGAAFWCPDCDKVP